MKTLVTGATGFIGSYLVEELLKKGHNVTCLVRKTSSLKWIEGLNVRLSYGDCLERQSLLNTIEDFDYIFHLAGLTKAREEKDYFSVNVIGTENLLHTVAEKNPNIKRFVYLSSLAATGPGLNSTPVNESIEPRPVSAYGRSKLEGEKVVLKYKDKIPVTILRPPAVYGPRDRDMYTLFKMLKKGIFLCWGKCYYSLIYVDDLVKGIVISSVSKKAEGKMYCMSDGNVYTNDDIVRAISSALGSKPLRLRIPRVVMPMFANICANIGQKLSKKSSIISVDRMRDFKYSYWVCDSSRAKDELGFIPKVGIKEGMKWTADWYRIHQWL
jgi:nucleoside-diphosphate-sugar epimerase